MTIVKDCQMCSKPFTTRTFKSATWEKYCPLCYQNTRSTTSIERLTKHTENDMTQLRDRVSKLEVV